MSLSVNHNYIVRRAFYSDYPRIEQLVRHEWLNYFGLDWWNFLVIEKDGDLIACGQLQACGDLQKLGSLVVEPHYRKQGIGTHLIKSLLEQADKPVYLSCVNKLALLYAPLGFRQVSWLELPDMLKLEFGLYYQAAFVRGRTLIFMESERIILDI